MTMRRCSHGCHRLRNLNTPEQTNPGTARQAERALSDANRRRIASNAEAPDLALHASPGGCLADGPYRLVSM
jgi:hypothetical protein